MLWQVVYIKMNTNDAQKSVSAPFLKKADVTKGLVSFFFFFFQDMENKIRSTLNEIYFGKTKDIVNGLR